MNKRQRSVTVDDNVYHDDKIFMKGLGLIPFKPSPEARVATLCLFFNNYLKQLPGNWEISKENVEYYSSHKGERAFVTFPNKEITAKIIEGFSTSELSILKDSSKVTACYAIRRDVQLDFNKKKLKSEQHQGVIKCLKHSYAFITAEKFRQDIFLHKSNIIRNVEYLDKGAKLIFEVKKAHREHNISTNLEAINAIIIREDDTSYSVPEMTSVPPARRGKHIYGDIIIPIISDNNQENPKDNSDDNPDDKPETNPENLPECQPEYKSFNPDEDVDYELSSDDEDDENKHFRRRKHD